MSGFGDAFGGLAKGLGNGLQMGMDIGKAKGLNLNDSLAGKAMNAGEEGKINLDFSKSNKQPTDASKPATSGDSQSGWDHLKSFFNFGGE